MNATVYVTAGMLLCAAVYIAQSRT